MSYRLIKHILLVIILSGLSCPAATENRIDTQRPDAPELAAYGVYPIGVRTLNVVNPSQINVLAIDANKTKPSVLPRYNRSLTLEVWYPATESSGGTDVLEAYLRDGKTKVELVGKAKRDAVPVKPEQAFPLVLISHGYPGNRFLLSHLAENIASKGYVVVSIDHTESTYRTQAAFGSTLVNRPLDQMFVLNDIANKSEDKTSFLYALVNANNTALIGYSMGAYGAVISAGGGVTQQAVDFPRGVPHKVLAMHQSTNKEHQNRFDSRLKTAITFAPWGMNYGMWDQSGLLGVRIPMLLVAGSVDDISGYENGVRAIWQGIKSVDRALLTFDNANHNAGAPMPAPKESYYYNKEKGFNVSEHYTDAVWDNARMNNVSQHFVTAWLNKYLKSDSAMDAYMALTSNSNNGVWAKNTEGNNKPEHTYWKGFANRTAKGLRFEKLKKGQ